MDYARVGGTGLVVSRIGLGCMSYGDAVRSVHPWTLDEETSQPFFSQALDLGISFFDTANVYSDGTSEEILGRALKRLARREDLVVATKVHGRMRPGPNGAGLSRKAVMTEIDQSLRRLQMDYVDLYQIHRWDPDTPVEETMGALHDVVKAGKARYIGASSMFAWQFAKAQFGARAQGRTEFASMQLHYNLLDREEEREMVPLCLDQGVGLLPWSPLARGRLARPAGEGTGRSESDGYAQHLYGDAERSVIDEVRGIASARGVSMAAVALAWVLSKPGVAAPIVGATKPHHLTDAVAALDLHLDADERAQLERHGGPHISTVLD
jgi:1-deoxyxylulose-5-phosphate synthase